MPYEWMGVEYISREVWLRAATLDLVTAGSEARDLPHEDLVAAQASLLRLSTCTT